MGIAPWNEVQWLFCKLSYVFCIYHPKFSMCSVLSICGICCRKQKIPIFFCTYLPFLQDLINDLTDTPYTNGRFFIAPFWLILSGRRLTLSQKCGSSFLNPIIDIAARRVYLGVTISPFEISSSKLNHF